MYKITEYTKEQAKKLNVEVKPSKRKNKKIDVFDKKDGKYLASVGQLGYKDYGVYLKEKGKEYANERREMFYKRFGKNVDKPNTNTFYSAKLLW